MRLKSFIIATALSFSLITPALAEATLKATINIAGRQRMLTQKMSKELLMVHLGINTNTNAENLAKTTTLFENSFQDILRGNKKLKIARVTDQKAFKDLMDVLAIWSNFSILNQHVSEHKKAHRGHVAITDFFNLPLLKTSNIAVQSIAKSAGKSGISPKLANTINLAGRQRMLSQKMSKEFLFILSDYKPDHFRSELKKTYTLFNTTLANLQNGNRAQNILAPTSEALTAQLAKVSNIWSNFKQPIATAINGENISTAQKNIIINQNLTLLKEMNKAVQLYTL